MNSLTTRRVKECIPQNHPISKEIVIFSHIPKTAGSALNRNLRANYEDTYCLHFWSHEKGTNLSDWVKKFNGEFSQIDSTELAHPRTIRGHVGFGIHEFLASSSCTYITLLREPTKRVISHYFRLKEYGSQDCEAASTAKSLTLQAFISQSRSIILDNLQTRFIAGIGWHQACNAKGWQQMLNELGQDPQAFHVRSGNCSSEMLEMAKKNLDRYFIFGLQDRFSDSLALFKKILGWKHVFDVEVHVRTKQDEEEIPESTIELIQERNRFDLELYKYAQERFDLQWNKYL